MNNDIYLIQSEDYIKHIDDKIFLYVLVKQLARKVMKLPSNRGNKELSDLAENCNALAEKMFRSWGIPKTYLYSSDPDELETLMDNELITPEDAGFHYCDGECECSNDEDDEDEFDEDEDDEFVNTVAGLSTTIHRIFGDDVSLHIIVGE